MSAKAWEVINARGLRKENDQYKAVCPAHEDKKESLSVLLNDNGVVLLRCFAGCATVDVVEKLGLRMGDLWPAEDAVVPPSPGRLVATYDYADEQGEVLYQVLRYDPKSFRQRRSDGAWKLGDVRRVLYRLPEIMESGKRAVIWVEGEKDADALRRLGFISTTVSGGVKGFRPEMVECLRDRTVIIFPDNDQPGIELAWTVKSHLSRSIIVKVPLSDPKSDVSDWIASGATKDTIIDAVRAQSLANCHGEVAIYNALGGKVQLISDVHH